MKTKNKGLLNTLGIDVSSMSYGDLVALHMSCKMTLSPDQLEEAAEMEGVVCDLSALNIGGKEQATPPPPAMPRKKKTEE